MAHAQEDIFWEMQDFSAQQMIDTRPEQGLPGPEGLSACVPRCAVPKVLLHTCSACCHCFWLQVLLGGITLIGEVLSRRYYWCRNREEGTGYALKCGNAAVFRNKFLCFRGCGREHLWREQICSSSRGLALWAACLPLPLASALAAP